MPPQNKWINNVNNKRVDRKAYSGEMLEIIRKFNLSSTITSESSPLCLSFTRCSEPYVMLCVGCAAIPTALGLS